jgi:GH25 family lysozyme M1 (1,4-beta-N-acetylmuramidase)
MKPILKSGAARKSEMMRSGMRLPHLMTRAYSLGALMIIFSLILSDNCLAIALGDYVRCDANVPARTGAGTGYSEISSAYYSPISTGGCGVNPGTVGLVTAGPTSANGYTWWQITWGQSPISYSGWSVDYSSGVTRLASVNAETRPCGVDVSSAQGTINWQTVSNTGQRFAFAKATAGNSAPPQMIDSQFVTNMVNGKAAGVLIGAYHYAYPQYNSATDEANFFLSVASNYITSGYLRPALDLEEPASGSTDYSAWADTWIQTVKSQTGVEPIIYTTPSYASAHLNSSLTNYGFWIANWLGNINSAPTTLPWSTWNFWQYNGDNPKVANDEAIVPGIAAKVDADVFNGTLASLTSQFVISQTQDTNPPTISAFSVSPNSVTVEGSVTISYTASDTGGSGLKTAQLWRTPDDGYGVPNPTSWQQVGSSIDISAGGNGPFQGSFSNTPPLVGTWWYGVHIVDGAIPSNWNDEANSQSGGVPGVFGPKAVTMTAPDTTPPSISITSPTTGSTYSTNNSTISLSGMASDNVGVTSVTWTNQLTSANGTASGTTSWTANSISLASGANVITVTAYDAAGNHTPATLTVTYTPPDTTPPSISITSPTAGSTYSTNSSTISLGGTASDNVGVTSVTWTNQQTSGNGTASGTTSWTANSISLASGANVITVTAYDAAGNHTPATLTVTYTPPDTTAPSISITSPTTGSTYSTNNSTISLRGTASDNVGVTSVTWTNQQTGANGTASGSTSWTASSITLASGANVITVTAYDAAGNHTPATLTVTYTPPDTTPPSISITSPTTGSTYSTNNSTISLGGTASDNVGVASVTWTNQQTSANGTASGTTSWTANSISLANGANVITVTAYDAAGNHTPATLTVTYTPASGSIISLSGNLAFGAVSIGSLPGRFLTISNSGTATLNVTNLNYPSGFNGSWSGSIAAGVSKYVYLTFAPTLCASYAGTISVTSDAGSGTNTIAVSGFGTSTDTNNPPIALGARIQPGNALVLAWPTNAVGFQLEYTTNLGPTTNWTAVGTAATTVNGQNVLTNPLTGRSMFFRLHQ